MPLSCAYLSSRWALLNCMNSIPVPCWSKIVSNCVAKKDERKVRTKAEELFTNQSRCHGFAINILTRLVTNQPCTKHFLVLLILGKKTSTIQQQQLITFRTRDLINPLGLLLSLLLLDSSPVSTMKIPSHIALHISCVRLPQGWQCSESLPLTHPLAPMWCREPTSANGMCKQATMRQHCYFKIEVQHVASHRSPTLKQLAMKTDGEAQLLKIIGACSSSRSKFCKAIYSMFCPWTERISTLTRYRLSDHPTLEQDSLTLIGRKNASCRGSLICLQCGLLVP